ncbi:P-loop containing nucleoside triphosphate hydrolase protein [Pluteus cervinus]|uniref:P-loop containing nucleoside triphosphate hydrolase protein n=1 Tax=Pluteus cervinus TaxID=181527 RepID=A0ACD3BGF9_9AGAR|nr:P-loop containing nucleoside triphosphate hydrolase protein [Pluteus cervinus]
MGIAQGWTVSVCIIYLLCRTDFTHLLYLRIWRDTLMVPTYFVGLSVLVLLANVTASSRPYRSLHARMFGAEDSDDEDPAEDTTSTTTTSISSEIRLHVAHHGGIVIFTYIIIRLLGCLALLGLSIFTAIEDELYPSNESVGFLRGRKKNGSEPVLTTNETLALAMCMFYFYVSLLGVISVSAKSKWGRRSQNHLCFLLLVAFAIYSYRDIFPLATYTVVPLDSHEGWVLWSKVTILTIVSIIIPLVIPQKYVPVDSKDPMGVPHPEQTASLFSQITYSYLTNFIWTSQKRTKTTPDDLPPQCDYDRASYLKARSFPLLDSFSGAKKRHLFFGLMKVFAWDYMILGLALLAQTLVGFSSPVGINQILKYVETGGKDAFIRPWFWVLVLFLGPIAHTCAFQWYQYVVVRVITRAEGIITQLVFEHALRTRVKAEGSTSANTELVVTPTLPPTADTPVTEHGGDQETLIEGSSHSREETLHGGGAGDSQAIASSSQSSRGQDTPKQALKGKTENFVGKLNNLVTTDTGNVVDARDFLIVVLQVPIQVTLCILFLYTILGWSAFVGLAVTLALFPIPGYLANLVQAIQIARLKKTDARIQTVTETMNIIRMVKLFGWERKMSERLAEKREEELYWVQKRNVLEVFSSAVNILIPVATMIATYTTYTVIMEERLSPSKVFSSMVVFDMIRQLLGRVFYTVMDVLSGKVSLDRLSDFLQTTELLDIYSEKPSALSTLGDAPVQRDQIGFKDASFAWTNEFTDGTLTPSKRNFRLRIDDKVTFKQGCINLILGPTGSGKTSLLMALLGEMHFIPTGPDSWFHLPREGGVAYAAQESWVQNETIRDNIVFGSPFDETRYQKVLHQCALERDLELFHAGDQTEVGEKGLTLSGGQKARVTLARAIYSQAKIILVDDVLAALERVFVSPLCSSFISFLVFFASVHTAKWIIDKCFSGDLAKGRTIILVTHNIAITRKVADFAITLDINGRVVNAGTIPEVLAHDLSLKNELEEESAELEILGVGDPPSSTTNGPSAAGGKLIMAEEAEVGHVGWKVFGLLLKALGGGFPVLYFISFVGVDLVSRSIYSFQTWYLGFWASQYQDHDYVNTFYYLSFYGMILSVCVALDAIEYLIFVFGQIRASRIIHRQLMDAVLGTTLRWMDTTPISRIIARCTQDIRSIDGPLPRQFHAFLETTLSMMVSLGAVLLFTPIFVIPASIIGVVGGWLGQIYITAQLSVKRELSNAKAPVLAHVGASIAGIVSIRAYGVEERFLEESLTRIDRYIRAQRSFYDLNRWITIRIDTLGSAFSAGLAAWLVYGHTNTATNTGFSLNMAIAFSTQILWWIRFLNLVEVEANSLERVAGYLKADQEPKPTPQGVPPAYWPASGELRVDKLSARYSPDGPKVLHDISFTVESGQHVGVVGRTGSGKSTLTLSLLRAIYTEGDVYYDGTKASTLNLDALRSKITIIPQMPELISGSLRQNLDPFEQFEDATLNDALRSAGLFSLQNDLDENRLTLDSAIASAGGNLSVGQRQVLALARAMVRGSKLLILDEATSAIDYKTDAVIQSTLRNELKDVTLITIAHRLQTIMDADKILVLDAGRLVEFDTPKNLLAKDNGTFRALVDESSDKEALYAMARIN